VAGDQDNLRCGQTAGTKLPGLRVVFVGWMILKREIKIRFNGLQRYLAETEGFEPSIPLERV
jgi:hypothetical protein